jgi:hypothetical protein
VSALNNRTNVYNPLLGNEILNELPRRESLGKQSVAKLRNNRKAVLRNPFLGNGSIKTLPRNKNPNMGKMCFLCGPCRGVILKTTGTHVEAGSNTSTVTLRAVGGDEKGNLEPETVKYGSDYQGTRTRERLRWQGPAAYTKDRPVLSSERAPHGMKNVTVRRIPFSERKKYLVVSPGWVLYTKTDWPTDRRS